MIDANTGDIVDTLLKIGGGAAGFKILEVMLARFFPSLTEKLTGKKTEAEAGAVSLTANIQAFQVTDKILTDSIQAHRNVIKELTTVLLELNRMEIHADNLSDLIGKSINLTRECVEIAIECEHPNRKTITRGFDNLEKEYQALQIERQRIAQERMIHKTT